MDTMTAETRMPAQTKGVKGRMILLNSETLIGTLLPKRLAVWNRSCVQSMKRCLSWPIIWTPIPNSAVPFISYKMSKKDSTIFDLTHKFEAKSLVSTCRIAMKLWKRKHFFIKVTISSSGEIFTLLKGAVKYSRLNSYFDCKALKRSTSAPDIFPLTSSAIFTLWA